MEHQVFPKWFTVLKISFLFYHSKMLLPVIFFASFENIFIEVLHILRATHGPYMTDALSRVIMQKSQLETKYLKTETKESFEIRKKKKSFSSKLNKKERKRYYNTLSVKM